MSKTWKIVKTISHSRCTNPWAPKAKHKYFSTSIGRIIRDEKGNMQLILDYTPTGEGTIWINDLKKKEAPEPAVAEVDEESPF